ncbi:MdlB ABC-type multidrug transport system, ATPase and permease components [Candidatus Nanopelagicaceae bacterium]
MFTNSVIGRSLRILSARDRKKIIAVIFIQISFGLLDLLGIALVGILGALAITGVQAKGPGNRVSTALQILQIEDQSLQSQATIVGLLAATLLITKTILSVIFVRKTVFYLSRRSADISANLISKVLSQPLIKVQARSMQQTLYTVTSGVDSIAMGVLNTAVLIISDTSLLIILGIGLFVVDPIVALSTLLVFSGIAYLLYRLMQLRAIQLGEEQRLISIESSEKILEVLNSYREIVVRNRRSFYSRELGKLRFKLADVIAERAFMPNISKYVIEITVVVGSLAIAGLQFAVNDAARAVAVLSVFMAASTRISPAVLRLQQGAINIKSSVGSAGPTLDLIEELEDISSGREKVDDLVFVHDGFVGDIELEDVTLTYPTKRVPAVRNVSIQIKQGQVVSLVGPSGAGKTTMIDIILGVLKPDSGKVKIQGDDPLKAIQLWPGAIGYVPQDVMISNGTIRQNVCLGYSVSEVPEERIWQALEVAQLSNFVRNLPDGLDTHVGDRGAKLSGGQRQRLGIARAMFTKPKLLVLDEATSALDGSTEASIAEAVHNLKGGVTIVMIAHRLSTVKESDVIHYLNEGELVMSGSFEELRKSIPEFDKQAKLMGIISK